MTSSGLCHVCKVATGDFHYNSPYKGNGHDGYWHCSKHGPRSEEGKAKTTEASKGKPLTAGMNRAERRLYERKGVIRE